MMCAATDQIVHCSNPRELAHASARSRNRATRETSLAGGAQSLDAASLARRACDRTAAFVGSGRVPLISRGLSCRIDHLLHFGDLRRRKAADLGVLADDGLVLGEIDAKGLVVGHVTLDPLNVRTELTQDLVRFCRRPSQLFALERADFGNIPFDDEFA